MPQTVRFSTCVSTVSFCAARSILRDKNFLRSTRLCAAHLWLAAVCLWLAPARPLAAYTPDDAQVQAMVSKGIYFLERSKHERMDKMYEGGYILVGYAVYKVLADKAHPLVKKGIEVSIEKIEKEMEKAQGAEKIMYEISIAAIFLADIDATLYRPQLLKVRDYLQRRQKRHGGFGYVGHEEGDTSQTQYALLAIWALQKNDIEMPTEAIERALHFLVVTQDPGGAWGYEVLPPPGPRLVKQDTATKVLGTAGLCALLIGADTIGILGKKISIEDDADIPKAFVRIDLLEKQRAKAKSGSMTQEDILGTVNRAVDYQRSSPTSSVNSWYYYYRYSEERYESFLELMSGKRDKSPAWYNTGVAELKKLQDSQGAWGTINTDFCPPDVCTAFAILYLIRSTQTTIAKLNEGVMAGGYGLPSDAGSVRRIGDRIVSEETASVEGLLEMMEKNKTDNVEVGLLPEDLKLSADPKLRKAQVARLARLLSGRDWKARRIAAKLLGRSEDINQVPELIYALTDPDPEVPAIAEESLRLLTRKLTARHLEPDSPPEKKQEAATYWREWYISMRPDYVFLEK